MSCYWFSVSWMLVYRYTGATVLVDITFQEGEHIDLFIGWQNKRDELYGWRVFSASFVELFLRWIMYTCLQSIVSNCKGHVFINRTFLSFLSFKTVLLKLFMADGHDFLNTVKRLIILTFWRWNYFFLILAHTVNKMWIIQEPNTLELWNKLHFEGGKNRGYIPCLKYSVPIFVE